MKSYTEQYKEAYQSKIKELKKSNTASKEEHKKNSLSMSILENKPNQISKSTE